MANEKIYVCDGANMCSEAKPGWFFQTPRWKRCSVYISILLSMASLGTAAFAILGGLEKETIKILSVVGLLINAISVALSALTSLDWRSEAVQDKKFLDQLLAMVKVHNDGKFSLIPDRRVKDAIRARE